MSELLHLLVSEIHENPNAVRQVDRTAQYYRELVDSVRSNGVLSPITVRKLDEGYAILGGLHRFTAARECGHKTIPAHVISLAEGDDVTIQLTENIQRTDMKPVEVSKALDKMLRQDPYLTIPKLAGQLHKSKTWVAQRMNLIKLTDQIQKLVDEGKIIIANAYALSKLPEEDQPDFLDRAITMNPGEFCPMAEAYAKTARYGNREGGPVTEEQFTPVAFLQDLGAIKREMANPKVGPYLCSELETPADGFALAIKWVLHMDSKSVEVQKSKNVQHERKIQAEKANLNT